MAYGGMYLWSSGWIDQSANRTLDKIYATSSNAGFKIQNVTIEGRVNTDREKLKSLIDVEKGEPIFAENLDDIRKRLESISWVKTARVERRLPDTLYIHLEERQPLALWQKDGKLAVVDAEGVVLTNQNLDKFSDLLIIVGEDAPQNAPDLVGMIAAEPEVQKRVESAKWIGNRRWDLVLQNDLIVRLPEEDAGMALRRLADAQKDESIMDRKIESIDLRDETRIVVQTRPGAVQEYKASFQPEKGI